MSKPNRRPAGEIRQSQILTTWGPGSMVDLPEVSVLIGGLDDWSGADERIVEDRLEAWLCQKLKTTELQLKAPPVQSSDPRAKVAGIAAHTFPTWFLAQIDETYTSPDGRRYRTRPLIPWEQLTRGGYLDENRKVQPVVPVRFVQACVRGHISDINWYAFVRRDFNASQYGELWFDEGGAANDFAEIFVRDKTNNNLRRPLSDATVPNSPVLGTCSGRQPWIGPGAHVHCEKPNRLLTRSASNAYFSQTMSVISIPEVNKGLKEAVATLWEDYAAHWESPDDLVRERRRPRVSSALEGFDNAAIWAEVERRTSGLPELEKGIREAEIETLLAQKFSAGEDQPGGDFFARAIKLELSNPALVDRVDRVVLVHRLREVVAQVSFTRFEAPLPDVDGELDLGVETAPLSRDSTWLPAIQNRGEGVFVAFNSEAIERWCERPAVRERAKKLQSGFATWNRERNGNARFPGLPFIMLHSLSHLLITAVSMDCGYAASSIRERIYAGAGGYGILLYTGSPGSEGTLGGLVAVGRSIERHLGRALELGRLCSNDPVCAQHDPENDLERRHLHGAGCHGCLLIAETSCERRNELLDRALVVPTVSTPDAAFFGSAP